MAAQRTEYELVVRGRIGSRLADALEGFEVTTSGPEETHLRGRLLDQAALHGALERIRDFGVELLEVHRIS